MEQNSEAALINKRQRLQLVRLRRLIDVVFALVIWRAYRLLPKPGEGEWDWALTVVFLNENLMTFLLIIIAIAIVIIYWLQHNALFNNLERTDGRHTALSILQLLFMLWFLYTIKLGVELGPSDGTRAFESCMAALMGIASSWSWAYAIKNHRLLSPDMTKSYAHQLLDRSMAEPITAIITIPIAFVGPVFWEISWLSYLLVGALLKRRRSRQKKGERRWRR